MPTLAAITPSKILQLWNSHPRVNEHSRLIAFSHDLVRTLSNAKVSEEHLTPLRDLGLTTGVYNALRRAGYGYVEEIDGLTTNELILVNHIGANSVKQIHDALTRWCRSCKGRQSPAAAVAIAPVQPVGEEEIESLIKAFYAWSSDRERMAALLLCAADLSSGPEGLRSLAMALVDSKDGAVSAEVQA